MLLSLLLLEKSQQVFSRLDLVMLFVTVSLLLFVLVLLISILLPSILPALIKSSFDFALFILLGEYYDSMNVSLTPILDSHVVSNSYRFGLSVNTYHQPHESDGQQVGTTNQINIVYWRPPF